jgi:hypothetical protein
MNFFFSGKIGNIEFEFKLLNRLFVTDLLLALKISIF